MRYILSLILVLLSIVIFLSMGCSKSSAPEYEHSPANPSIDQYPSWSPDGKRILYYHRGIFEIYENGFYKIDPDSAGIWIVNVDGSNPHIILKASTVVIAEWSPDGNWIVFGLSEDSQIYKAKVSGDQIDTLSIQQLTSNSQNFFPTWSHDGEWIVYDSNILHEGTLLFDIWKMKNDGTQKTRIKEYARMPHWSPKGDRIVHIQYIGDGNPEIFTMSISGEDLVQVTSNGKWNKDPRYSPDGMKILFSIKSSVFVINDNGEELSNVFNGGGYPSWSPDGSKIVFCKSDLSNSGNNGTIWVMNIDDSDLHQITHGIDTE